MKRPRTGQGQAKMKADLAKKSETKKKKSSLKINSKTGVYSNYRKEGLPMSAKQRSNLTDRQRSGDDDVKPGYKVNKGPGGGLRPSRRPKKRPDVK
jgi:hypothetical protein